MINEEVAGKSVEVGCRVTNLSLDLILKGLDYVVKKLEGKPATLTILNFLQMAQGKLVLML